ncbi:TPA: DNA cytosine methyltransferase [Pseudomonas aeruginosa]|uniref:DNA cytosine methyltransferase n=1 Tax=Pseudomonas aeruginosa TaxID=287 RepID=UPI0019693386|nr:DNA cytosine methyltransferase [Pseudomonas aeruginosa]HCT7101465.1 DNA cytosine methyltransferase [Pseudomonas aeruginosa]HEN8507886.1 DNA cytosine methyltransferase [Pseudomonas aeruginosa]HEN8756309.1 DNA cytosine methyltransferase [Pseudomonas aeruginosa]HEN8806080.1 DNA cytosine methyltransferase [Pseudomonas aeruginosa]
MDKPVSELKPSVKKPLLASLFCGAGGLDVGFINAGFNVEFAADYDQAAVRTYNVNHPGNKARVIDLLDTSTEQLYEMATGSLGSEERFEGIIGGPPCQGFSRANVGRCHTDPRNQLALKYADVVNLFYERSGIQFFVFENVPEILARKNKDFLAGLRANLSRNFNIYEQEINASAFGVAQLRRRYFIVGVAKGVAEQEFSFPVPDEGKVKVVADMISGLPEPAYYSFNLSPSDIPHHQNHWTMRPKSKRFLTGDMPEGGRSFIKLEWSKPSRTVAYGNREIHIHPSGRRRLSIYEAMLLQGFEHEYVLLGNLSEQVKQVSNAVPPPVAKRIADAIFAQIFNR